jgi:hypothetical protein
MMAQAASDYKNLKGEFRDALFGILESYQKGEITADVMESMWRSEIKGSWEKAYEFGVRSVGNPFGVWEQDKSWLKGAETEEYGYLGSFVDDIKNNELTMGVEDRLAMYVETLDGVYHHGMVDGSPEFVKIHWILKEAKHCDDCIRFAAGGPYTKKTLPAVPRDGTSRCLSNCRCELRFEYAEEKPAPEMYVIKGPKPMVLAQGYRLASSKEADRLGTMYAEIERLRGLIQATSGDAKRELIIRRRDVNAAMIDFMEKHKIYWVPGGQTQKAKIVESIVDEVKKELLLEGGPGSGHFGHKGRPGLRGGSLPGGRISAHGFTGVGDWIVKRGVHVSASRSEKKTLYDSFKSVPVSHLKLSGVKTITVMNSRQEVNDLYLLRTGDSDRSFTADAFYDHDVKEMVISPGAKRTTILHEFAHSLVGLGAYKKKVWEANASTGKVTRYGSTNMEEGFCEAYALRAVRKDYLKKRAPKVADVMDRVFSL